MRSSFSLLAGLCVFLAACGGSGTTSSPAPTGPAGPALSIALPSTSLQSGTTMQVSAMLDGSPASNVVWSSSNTQVASIDGAGVVEGRLRGLSTITATSGSRRATATLEVKPGAPVSVNVYLGDGQFAAAGSAVADPLCTTVTDAAGNRITGAMVQYSVTTGEGRMGSPSAARTDAAGIAISGAWTLGSRVGENTVTATSAGATSVTFRATGR